MTETLGPVIAGQGRVDCRPEVPMPLDEIIFRATKSALIDAGCDLADVDAVVMASSDLFDGRAISTMTLTASTGSFGKHETRVCCDGLGALAVAVADLRSGRARTIIVSGWSKLSDANLDAIEPLGAEPIFHRDLGFTSEIVRSLRRSAFAERVDAVDPRPRPSGDGAIALVLRDEPPSRRSTIIRGLGWSAGPYLRPGGQPLAPIVTAVQRSLADANVEPEAVECVRCIGFKHTPDNRLLELIGLRNVPVMRSVRGAPVDVEVGYAEGLFALAEVFEDDRLHGLNLILAASGMGDQRGYAAIVERQM